MKNKTIQNINLQQLDLQETQLKEHELLIINKLKNLTQTYILSKKKKTTRSSFDDVILQKNQAKWFNYFFYSTPINLLFSLDQFLFAISKHKKAFQGRKSSEFQQLLKEKKKIHFFYGYFSKKQLKRILSQSKSCQGYYSKNFFALLERRLDVVLYRSGLVKNIYTARQLIAHKKIQVNHSVNTSTSYQVSPGDIISIIQNKKNQIVNSFSKIIRENFKNIKTRGSGKSFSPYILSRLDVSQSDAKTMLSVVKTPFLHNKVDAKKTLFFCNRTQKIENKSLFKKSRQKNVLKNSIRLLLTKIHSRTHLKINKSSLSLNILLDELFTFKNYQIASFFDFGSKNHQINNKKNFAVLKLKPSQSKQANFFLSMCTEKKKSTSFISKHAKYYRKQCVQKNFLSVDRKPFIQNKITDSLNLLDMYYCRDFNYYLKNQQKKQGKILDFSPAKLENNGLSLKYKTQKQYKNLADNYSTIFTRKKNRAVFKKTLNKILLQMHSSKIANDFLKKQSTREKNDYFKNSLIKKRLSSLFKIKFKKYIKKKPFFAQKRKALRYFGIKPMHLEISYKLNTVIFLYSPQRLSFPFYINVDLITRFFR